MGRAARSYAEMASRAEARHRLRAGEEGVVVASVRAAIQRVSPSSVAPILIRKGDSIELGALVDRLAGAGYERTDRVDHLLAHVDRRGCRQHHHASRGPGGPGHFSARRLLGGGASVIGVGAVGSATP